MINKLDLHYYNEYSIPSPGLKFDSSCIHHSLSVPSGCTLLLALMIECDAPVLPFPTCFFVL